MLDDRLPAAARLFRLRKRPLGIGRLSPRMHGQGSRRPQRRLDAETAKERARDQTERDRWFENLSRGTIPALAC
jgi:hypothetical protein